MADQRISDLTHDTSLSGTEKVPLSPDGYATTQEIADLAVPDSRLSLGTLGPQSIAQDVQTQVQGWEVKSSAGSDFTLDASTNFAHILTAPCTILVQATCVFVSAHSSTRSFMDIYAGDAAGTTSGIGTIFAGDYGANGVAFPIDAQETGMSAVWLHFMLPGSVQLLACPQGGSAPEAISFAGMDILRLR